MWSRDFTDTLFNNIKEEEVMLFKIIAAITIAVGTTGIALFYIDTYWGRL